jgi:hypothetical protein
LEPGGNILDEINGKTVLPPGMPKLILPGFDKKLQTNNKRTIGGMEHFFLVRKICPS